MWRRVWVWKRVLASRTTYAVQWYDEAYHRRTRAYGSNKKLAYSERRRLELELNAGLLRQAKQIRLAAFMAEHLQLEQGRLAPATIATHREVLQHLLNHGGDVLLSQVSFKRAEEFVAACVSKRLAEATVNRFLRTLSGIFAAAARRGYEATNAWRQVKRLREPEREIRALNLEEVGRLLAACQDDELRAVMVLALTAGMRRGEICGLTWDDVDLAGRLVLVNARKTHKVYAQPLVPQAVACLSRLREARVDKALFHAKAADHSVARSMALRFESLRAKAGLAACSLHDLRRTFNSLLHGMGVSAEIRRRLMRHSSLAVTDAYYTRIVPEDLRRAAESLPFASAS